MLEDIDNMKKDIQDYLEIKFDLIRLQIAESLSRILSSVINMVILCFLLALILFFLSFSAAYYFSSLLHSNELGFLCVTGFYGLILLFFIIFRKRIIERPVIKAMVKLIFSKISSDEEN